MSTKASNTTPHYGLSQWESEDHILRSDFNHDLSTIDSALHAHDEALARAASSAKLTAVEEKITVLRLFSKTFESAVSSFTIDLSGVDLKTYQQLRLCIRKVTTGDQYTNELLLRVNGDSGESSYGYIHGGEVLNANAAIGGYISFASHSSHEIALTDTGNGVAFAKSGHSSDGRYAAKQDSTSYLWKNGGLGDITSLQVFTESGKAMTAGFEVSLYGEKK